jgi:hypothetical protein
MPRHVLTMRPSLDVAVPRAEKQLATTQHLLLVGGWLPQRPRRAWAARHARTRCDRGKSYDTYHM